jgi:hypothetical protein
LRYTDIAWDLTVCWERYSRSPISAKVRWVDSSGNSRSSAGVSDDTPAMPARLVSSFDHSSSTWFGRTSAFCRCYEWQPREGPLPKSRYRQHGERVVSGQRMMQAVSDIFLGWTKGEDRTRHYYWRQLRDMKGSAEIETMDLVGLSFYAGICGWTLARAHARSGDPIAIAAYLGSSDRFDKSIGDFSQRYADQNELDHEAFVKAIRSGRLEAHEGV